MTLCLDERSLKMREMCRHIPHTFIQQHLFFREEKERDEATSAACVCGTLSPPLSSNGYFYFLTNYLFISFIIV
jgi:hypothetical protein